MNPQPTGRRLAVAGALLSAALALTPFAARSQLCPMPGQSGSCTTASPLDPLDAALQPKFVYDLPQPIFYVPDRNKFPGFDYYEISVQPVSQIPVAFPQPPTGSPAVPAGHQWLGLVDANGNPLYTEVWGYAQTNNAAYPLNGLATYPSMSFRATKGTNVKVKWTNNLPDNHLFCKQPLNSDVPCGIDRTLMGTLLQPGETLGPYGSAMQPDNAVVVHLHGGEIPPDSDGMAELWIGNRTTANTAPYNNTPLYPLKDNLGNPVPNVNSNLSPPFVPPPNNGIPADANYAKPGSPGANGKDSTWAQLRSVYQPGQLIRPTGNSIFYNYPIVQDAATIWYHDHALGKTRVNVAAGPAGYFYVQDPLKDALLGFGNPQATNYYFGDCSNSGILAGKCRDIPLVLQDRAFNADGSINFPNGLGQSQASALNLNPAANGNPLTPGPNPTVHPQWVPEYFGDHAVVNGVIWPKLEVEPAPYRFRFLDGSNARCYTLTVVNPDAANVLPPVYQIASDQGYLPRPVPLTQLTLCPGERAEVVIDFSQLPAGASVYLRNTAGAPFPDGPTPDDSESPFPHLGRLVKFHVTSAPPRPAWDQAAFTSKFALLNPKPALKTTGATRRQMVLNEVLDRETGDPLAVQIDGKHFEDAVTETPTRGTVEVWSIVNTTVDAHPMHLHLVQYQVLSRQMFAVDDFKKAAGITDENGVPLHGIGDPPLTRVDVTPYLRGQARGPDANEVGWKDTAKAYPGEVLTIAAKWDGRWKDCPVGSAKGPNCNPVGSSMEPYFEKVTSGPYVWHCHIVDHEDNEMMRPTLVLPAQ